MRLTVACNMFACVKFLNDSHINEPCFVPISAIKSFDPLNFDQKKQYNVFWSPNEDDDPINFKEEFNADNDKIQRWSRPPLSWILQSNNIASCW